MPLTQETMGTDRIRVLLADDHAVLRAGLKALLANQPDMEVVGEAEDGEDAVRQVKTLRPDVVVMDITMPKMNGLDATRDIVLLGYGTRILVLTMHDEEQYLLQVLQAGGSGYVLKRSADNELIEAIRTVQSGGVFLYHSATKMLLEDYLKRVRAGDASEKEQYDGLSEREREVLKLTAEGFSNQEIAERLFLSVKTVDTYRSRIMDKLGFHHRSELVQYALRKGLLSPH